jgi:hypothetical protein
MQRSDWGDHPKRFWDEVLGDAVDDNTPPLGPPNRGVKKEGSVVTTLGRVGNIIENGSRVRLGGLMRDLSFKKDRDAKEAGNVGSGERPISIITSTGSI